MISRIEGELLAVGPGRVEVRCAGLCYELLVPAVDSARLNGMVGREAAFHTLHYLESQGQGSAYLPRLLGFQSAEERGFFELLTSVKGLGPRKALRALELPVADIAIAIAERNIDLLVALPEIGKRTAQTIVLELGGKVDRYIESKTPVSEATGSAGEAVRDAVAVLVQLGEGRLHARRLVDRAIAADPSLDTADALVAAAFRLKEMV